MIFSILIIFTSSVCECGCFVLDTSFVCHTCSVGAACGVEGALSENDLVSDDAKAVDVSFLRGSLYPQMLRGSPQV